jgi:hypothetical protein
MAQFFPSGDHFIWSTLPARGGAITTDFPEAKLNNFAELLP